MKLADTIALYSNYALEDRITFQGLQISVENKAGSVREGVDDKGKPWKTKMQIPYGYIRLTKGVDGDHVDCFVNESNPNAENAYIVHQVKPDTGEYDEDKVMLGFNSEKEAKEAYLAHYDDPNHFGSMVTVPMEKFKKMVLDTKDEPIKLAAGGPGSGRYPKGSGADKLQGMIQKHIPDLPGIDKQKLINAWVDIAKQVHLDERYESGEGYCAAVAGQLWERVFKGTPGWGVYDAMTTEETDHVFIAGHGLIVDGTHRQVGGLKAPMLAVLKDTGQWREEGAWEKNTDEGIKHLLQEWDDLVKQGARITRDRK